MGQSGGRRKKNRGILPTGKMATLAVFLNNVAEDN